MTARPTCALEHVKDQHGDAGLRAVATFLHRMGSDGTLAWGEASWTPCDMVMQEAWEMGGAPPPLTEAKLRFMCEQLREWAVSRKTISDVSTKRRRGGLQAMPSDPNTTIVCRKCGAEGTHHCSMPGRPLPFLKDTEAQPHTTRPEWGADGSNCEPFMQARIKAMKDSKAQSNTTELQAELDRQNARNNKLQELLLKMERLWPDDEQGAVRSLITQTEATKGVLRDCSERLEKRR